MSLEDQAWGSLEDLEARPYAQLAMMELESGLGVLESRTTYVGHEWRRLGLENVFVEIKDGFCKMVGDAVAFVC